MLVEEGAAAIAGYFASVLGPIPAIVFGAVAAFLAFQAAWLAWADSRCEGGGAFLEEPWLALGAPGFDLSVSGRTS